MKTKSVMVGALTLMSFAAKADIQDHTIWLRPGQCIVVGNQQICAQRMDDPGALGGKPNPNREVHTCKNGIKDEVDPKLTGWAHVVIVMGPNGKKLSEEVIKTYGPVGQKECETELKTLKTQM